jgi:hypothetical protein
MWSTGDFGRFLAVLGAGLTLAACGASAPQASVANRASTTPATSHSAATPSPSPKPSPRPSHTRAATHANPASPQPATYGNPAGHASIPPAAGAVSTSDPDHVIGNGTPASCTSAAVVQDVAEGGIITFNCGQNPVTITMTATAQVVHGNRIVIDGGGKVTLSGGGQIRILQMDTCPTGCWEQPGPQLIVQNMRFVDGYSGAHQTSGSSNYGGGAIFDQGGQLKVVNSEFVDNGCYQFGPDLGGGAIRAYGMDMSTPVYITDDTFSDNKCSNGGALSGLYANFVVINSLFSENSAIGWGQNPAQSGTPGGGSGGAVYTDGDTYNLIIDGTAMQDNSAREGGGAIFCVVDNDQGTLTIEYSTLQQNASGQFQNAPGIFDALNGQAVQPAVIDSTIN